MKLQFKLEVPKSQSDLIMQFITQEVAIIHFELLDEVITALKSGIPQTKFTKKLDDLLMELSGDRGRLTKYFEKIAEDDCDLLPISQYILQNIFTPKFEYPIEILSEGHYYNAILPVNKNGESCMEWIQKDIDPKTGKNGKCKIKMIIKDPSTQTKGEENVFYRD